MIVSNLNSIRYQQQYQQLQNRLNPGAGSLVAYGTRDVVTGQRLVETADGGKQVALYISNSALNGTMAVSQFSSIGLPGYISQKPN